MKKRTYDQIDMDSLRYYSCTYCGHKPMTGDYILLIIDTRLPEGFRAFCCSGCYRNHKKAVDAAGGIILRIDGPLDINSKFYKWSKKINETKTKTGGRPRAFSV